MLEERTRVLLILPRDLTDRARILAGRSTTLLRAPVSLQIVLRALIEEGLKRDRDPGLLATIEDQAKAIRRTRSLSRRPAAGRPAKALRKGHDESARERVTRALPRRADRARSPAEFGRTSGRRGA